MGESTYCPPRGWAAKVVDMRVFVLVVVLSTSSRADADDRETRCPPPAARDLSVLADATRADEVAAKAIIDVVDACAGGESATCAEKRAACEALPNEAPMHEDVGYLGDLSGKWLGEHFAVTDQRVFDSVTHPAPCRGTPEQLREATHQRLRAANKHRALEEEWRAWRDWATHRTMRCLREQMAEKKTGENGDTTETAHSTEDVRAVDGAAYLGAGLGYCDFIVDSGRERHEGTCLDLQGGIGIELHDFFGVLFTVGVDYQPLNANAPGAMAGSITEARIGLTLMYRGEWVDWYLGGGFGDMTATVPHEGSSLCNWWGWMFHLGRYVALDVGRRASDYDGFEESGVLAIGLVLTR
jgi:hypothetical protein